MFSIYGKAINKRVNLPVISIISATTLLPPSRQISLPIFDRIHIAADL